MRNLLFLILFIFLTACTKPATERLPASAPVSADQSVAGERIDYPAAARGEQADTYHDQIIADPYRWMEDLESPELASWIAAQNRLVEDYVSKAPGRSQIEKRLTELFDFERYGIPQARGGRYFYTRNDGLQNQAPVYWQQGLDGEPRLLIDPNALSADGTIALADWQATDDGKLIAYALSDGGSDWRTIRVRNVDTAADLDDTIEWAKFTSIAWLPDASGFYYSRYDAPAPGTDKLKTVNEFQKLFFHRIGTPQSADLLVYERKDQPNWGFSAQVADDASKLVIRVSQGTDERNLLLWQDLTQPEQPVRELVSEFVHAYSYVGTLDDQLFVLTDDGAERYRILAIDLDRPERDAWREVVPQSSATMTQANLVGGRLIVQYLADAQSAVEAWSVEGNKLSTLSLPGIGTASGFGGSAKSSETFFSFQSYTQAPGIYRFAIEDGQISPFRLPSVGFDPDRFETRQVFYAADDGQRIPMFITARRGTIQDGSNPTILYAYGGFNVSVTPTFSPLNIVWMEMGGVYAVANIRGGGEYGRTWHEAAMKTKRPRAFDDFANAAEYLIAERWTNAARLAISGRSNGGLLVAATALRRPELFAAALPAVGVLDMLRFRDFTIGWAWESDYGSVRNADEYAVLRGYSPLHNVRPGVEFPAILITTADRDDRVFPAHSFKFAAQMQHTATSTRPILLRTETRAGHGAGKPTSKIIEENTDIFAFLERALNMDPLPIED